MITKLFRLYICILFLIIHLTSNAQPYTFSKRSGSYENLSTPSGIWVNQSWGFSSPIKIIDIGFTFNYFNRNYTKLLVFTTGAIGFDRKDKVGFFDKIFGLSTKLKSKTSTAPWVSGIAYQIDGIAPNRILKVETNNAGFQGSKDTSNYANFQIWLFETSNNIEIHYGLSKFDSTCWFEGHTGPYVGLDTTNEQVVYLLGGDPNQPVYTIDVDTVLTGIPSSGLIYSFEPFKTGLFEDLLPVRSESRITIYPNPGKPGNLRILHLESNFGYSVRLVDFSGKSVMDQTIVDNTINLDAVKQGIYFYSIIKVDGSELTSGKIVLAE